MPYWHSQAKSANGSGYSVADGTGGRLAARGGPNLRALSRYTALVVAIAEPRPVAVEVAAALVRLIEFSTLESAWDGDAARPPAPAALRNAMLFLIEQLPDGPAPAVGPGLDGSIEMEWELAGRPSVSVTFNTDGTAYFTAFTSNEVRQEAQFPAGAPLAAAVIDALG